MFVSRISTASPETMHNFSVAKTKDCSKDETSVLLRTIPTNVALAQISSVSFKERDDLSAYHTYNGPRPPEIEVEKYNMSVAADNYMREGNYIKALEEKCKIAKICEKQEKFSDVMNLRNGIKEGVNNLTVKELKAGIAKISEYYPALAKEIAEDLPKYIK